LQVLANDVSHSDNKLQMLRAFSCHLLPHTLTFRDTHATCVKLWKCQSGSLQPTVATSNRQRQHSTTTTTNAQLSQCFII